MCVPPGYLFYRPPISPHYPPTLPYGQRPQPPATFPLPIKAVSVEAKVVDFCASVTVRQTFVNVESGPIEAIYQFRLEDKATVSDFTAVIDGNKIKGTIQEKEEAKNTYDDAIASGHGAYLMEEKDDEPNIFTVNVGNLPPGKQVEIAITYVTELAFTDDGQLELRVASQNDNPSYNKAASSNSLPPLKLRVDFDMTSNIRSMSSPSHPITFEFGEEPNQATVTLAAGDSGGSQPAKDLVVLTKLAKPHQPCGRVEKSDDAKGTTTVMASIYPQLQLAADSDEDIYTEMIFIVDRSGSMSGGRISQVRDTLQIFLRSLGEGTLFNIIGFGSRTEHLFRDGSVEYNDKNLEVATKHVTQMTANLGGTNILRPLEEVLRAKTKEGYPRQLFILTDGEVDNTNACVAFVRKHADTTRVFTFGVGNEASQELVKGLAKAGEGFYEFVRSGEAMEEKVMRQLRRAMQPALTDITVTWNAPPHRQVQPAPFRLPPLFCGGRLVVYAILDNSSSKGDDDEVEVVVSAKTVVKPFEARLKVDLKKATAGNLLSKLAAKALLRDLEEGRSYMHDLEGRPKPGKDVVREMVHVSLASGVLSKHTAFVAVEEREEATEGTMKVRRIPVTFEKAAPLLPMPPPPMPMYYAQQTGMQMHQSSSSSSSFLPPPPPIHAPMPVSYMCPPPPGGGPPRSPMAGYGGPPPPPMSASPMCPPPPGGGPPRGPMAGYGGPPPPPMAAYGPPPPMAACGPPPTPSCAPVSYSAPSAPALAYPSVSPWAVEGISRSRQCAQPQQQQQAPLQLQQNAPMMSLMKKGSAGPPLGSAAPPAQMRDIIMKQKASGSWEWNDAVALVGMSSDKLRSGIPSAKLVTVDKEVECLWATAVVAALLQTRFADQKTNWELVVQKAMKFINRQKKNVKLNDASATQEIDWLQLATAFLAAA